MGPRAALAVALAVLLPASVAVSACSSGGQGAHAPEPTFDAGNVRVAAAFPHHPLESIDPAGLTGNFPSGTAVTAWIVGRLGSIPEPGSFELAIVRLPASVSPGLASRLLAEFSTGAPPARFEGHAAYQTYNAVGTATAGLLSVDVAARTLLVVGAYGQHGQVTAFIGSVRLVKA